MKTIYLFILFFFVSIFSIKAQWDGTATTVYNPVSTTPANEQYAYSISDGSGGIIALWTVNDFGSNTTGIYCQRKTVHGLIPWGDSSTPVLLSDSVPMYSAISLMDAQPDGFGGAYISWNILNNETAEVYLQHINRSGQALYIQGGIKVTAFEGNYAYGGKLCANTSGVFVCWNEEVKNAETVLPGYAEVMVQRYSHQGVPQWSAAVPVSTVTALRAGGRLVSDGNGGVLVAFVDTRNSQFDENGNADNIDIYAQHFSSSGARLWGVQDAVVSAAAYNQVSVANGGSEIFNAMIADSAGGFILVYNNYVDDNDNKARLYAQRLDGNGNRLWDTAGVELYTAFASANARLTQVLADGAAGMVLSWDVNFISGYSEVHVQRIAGDGSKPWGASGTRVSPAEPGAGFHDQSNMVADGTGSYAVVWSNRLQFAVKGQRINSAGQLLWDTAGVDICTNQFSVPSQPVVTSSDSNAVIVTWGDQRNSFTGNESDLYAAKIDSNGQLVHTGLYISVANGNWDEPATWQGNAVPPYGAAVLVRHDVIANVNAACKSLRVQQPGSLTVVTEVYFIMLQ